MKFNQRSYKTKETIAAVATAPGEGGVAIVRISGPHALEVGAKVFSKDVTKLSSHRVSYGKVLSSEGEKVDDVLLIPMHAPKSFTGEHVVEIHCHGGSLITRRVLEVCLAAGARAALPGEFSFQAFMNKKIDLSQAEAIQALIGAKSERALVSAEQQLEGRLSRRITSFQKELTHIAAIIEAWVDFPEEDLEFAPFSEIVERLTAVKKEIALLERTFHQGKMVHEGLHLSLVGSPNVGKSSLMNTLLGKDRSIVSEKAGTTRDIVEDHLSLNGYHIRLLDTAGIRKTDEAIEEEGIRRSKKAIERSDLILAVLDVTRSVCHETEELLKSLPRDQTIAVWNKIDLPHDRPLPSLSFPHVVELSCTTGEGIERLHSAIDAVVTQGIHGPDELVITSLRHKEALRHAMQAIDCVIEGLNSGSSPEFVALDLRLSLRSLGIIIGTDVTEDILTAVFSTFCIGK